MTFESFCRRPLTAAISATALLLLALACSSTARSAKAGEDTPHPHANANEKNANTAKNLLAEAFDSASAIPSEPHIKSKNLYQRMVISTCLELNLPEEASRYADQLTNWRRGTAHADIGQYYAQHDNPKAALKHAQIAEELAASIDTWHKDRIRTHLARLYAALGDSERLEAQGGGLAKEEAAKLRAARAESRPDDEFKKQRADIESLMDSERFDIVQQGLTAAAHLFDRYYADTARREVLEETIVRGLDELPPVFRIELLMQMAEAALAHDDSEGASALISRARKLYDAARWRAESGVPTLAAMARITDRAGDEKQAERLIKAAQRLYEKDVPNTPKVFRTRSLLPVAEAQQATGKTAAAKSTYLAALNVAADNPNARPRAEDLTRILCSMARWEHRPDDETRSAIKKLRNSLGAPW